MIQTNYYGEKKINLHVTSFKRPPPIFLSLNFLLCHEQATSADVICVFSGFSTFGKFEPVLLLLLSSIPIADATVFLAELLFNVIEVFGVTVGLSSY